MNDLETSVVAVYIIMATASACGLAYMLRQALNDPHLSRVDPPVIRTSRKVVFGVGAYFLLLTAYCRDYWLVHPSLVAVGLVVIGFMLSLILILTVNIVSLKLRQPPLDGAKIRLAGYAAPARLRRSQYP